MFQSFPGLAKPLLIIIFQLTAVSIVFNTRYCWRKMVDNNGLIEIFNEKLKTKTFEQFSILMCDLDQCDPDQRCLLHSLLVDDYKSVKNWSEYISYVVSNNPERKLQLQRLINKSLEFLDESELKDDKHYLAIHLESAKLKRYLII
jgi:hypothetical protein